MFHKSYIFLTQIEHNFAVLYIQIKKWKAECTKDQTDGGMPRIRNGESRWQETVTYLSGSKKSIC